MKSQWSTSTSLIFGRCAAQRADTWMWTRSTWWPTPPRWCDAVEEVRCWSWSFTGLRPPCSLVRDDHFGILLSANNFSLHCAVIYLSQEPLICFKHSYLAKVGALPAVPRPLAPPIRKKRLGYLEIGQLLLKKFPSESTARSIRFILKLCRNEAPEPLVPLPWLARDPQDEPDIEIGLPSALARLAPVMRFNARHR